MCALPQITLQDRVSPPRRAAALSGLVADKGSRKWVYQAQAYERTGHLDFALVSLPPPKNNVYIYIYIYTHVYIYIYIYIERERELYKYTYIYNVCIYDQIYIYIYIYVYICVYIYIYIYMYRSPAPTRTCCASASATRWSSSPTSSAPLMMTAERSTVIWYTKMY